MSITVLPGSCCGLTCPQQKKRERKKRRKERRVKENDEGMFVLLRSCSISAHMLTLGGQRRGAGLVVACSLYRLILCVYFLCPSSGNVMLHYHDGEK